MKKITLTILTFCLVSFCLVPNLFAKKAKVEQPKLSLHEACEFGSFTEVKEAITSSNINSSGDVYGITPIMAACRGNSSLEIFQLLISSGAKVNAKDVNGKTPLMYAAEYDTYEKVLKELIKAGANVNAKTDDGTTALMLACENNRNTKIVQALIDAGANINATDNSGYDMADYAESNKKKDEVMDILVRAGFKPSVKAPVQEQIDNEKADLGMNTQEQVSVTTEASDTETQKDLENIGVEVKADNE